MQNENWPAEWRCLHLRRAIHLLAPEFKIITIIRDEILSGDLGLCADGFNLGRGDFIAGGGQAVVSHHRVHRVCRRVRQARLHVALIFLVDGSWQMADRK